jgi:iron complex transport system ATP-binding protein
MCELPTEADAAPTPLIELDRATVLRGARPALHAISFRIASGQHTAILGPNGCGKSTFVKLIHRELYPLARPGSAPVRVLGQERWDVFALRAQLGLVSADVQRDLFAAPDLSAEGAVLSGFFASRRAPAAGEVSADMRERAADALAAVGAAHLQRRAVAELSTGEARRVLIARALAHAPRALLLDEPTAGLDIAARHRFLDMLQALAEAGTGLVLVTHHVEEIVAPIERVIMLREGQVFADGEPQAVLTSPRLSALYGIALRLRGGRGAYRLEADENITFSPAP